MFVSFLAVDQWFIFYVMHLCQIMFRVFGKKKFCKVYLLSFARVLTEMYQVMYQVALMNLR
jgi:hypothetical protein